MMRVGNALLEMVRRREQAHEHAARSGNLHPTDFRCIGFLRRAGRPLSPKEIIGYLQLSSGSGTALLDRLEALGYVHRLPNPDDRRGVLIALDETAAAVPIALYRRLEQQYRDVTDAFSDPDLDRIAEFLEQIAHLPDAVDT